MVRVRAICAVSSNRSTDKKGAYFEGVHFIVFRLRQHVIGRVSRREGKIKRVPSEVELIIPTKRLLIDSLSIRQNVFVFDLEVSRYLRS